MFPLSERNRFRWFWAVVSTKLVLTIVLCATIMTMSPIILLYTLTVYIVAVVLIMTLLGAIVPQLKRLPDFWRQNYGTHIITLGFGELAAMSMAVLVMCVRLDDALSGLLSMATFLVAFTVLLQLIRIRGWRMTHYNAVRFQVTTIVCSTALLLAAALPVLGIRW